jgi:hypothetical protein
MFFEIVPRRAIGTPSFRLGKNFLGKDRDRNCFVALLSERDRIFQMYLVEDGVSRPILKNADHRLASRPGILTEYRLAEAGARLLREVYHSLGDFYFCFFRDDQSPGLPTEAVAVDERNTGFLLKIGNSISVTANKKDELFPNYYKGRR